MSVRGVAPLVSLTLLVAGCDRLGTANGRGSAVAQPGAVAQPRPEVASRSSGKIARSPDRIAASSSRPQIAALVPRVFIRARPHPKSPEIGALAMGDSLELTSPQPVSNKRCARGWYEVEPTGFICLDRTTTLHVEDHPLVRAKRAHRADFAAVAPYAWGESREAPLYRKLPTAEEQARWEYQLASHLVRVEKAREAGEGTRRHRTLEGVDVSRAVGQPPGFLADHAITPYSAVHTPLERRPRAGFVPPRSTIAWTDEFWAEGRSWLLTSDLLLVPKDRIVQERPLSFRGVRLDGTRTKLPIAFIRFEPRRQHRLSAEANPPHDAPGRLVATDATWDRLEWVSLTGHTRLQRGVRYLQTTDQGRWIREQDATVVRAQVPRGIDLERNEKWIDVSIYRGTLVAYQGNRPVFATLISPGLLGYRRENGKPAKYTTPTGTFRIEWKHLSTTMSPDPERMSYYLSEVPFTQFFHLPFALHAAYWHDRFGEPKSGGCINLSMADAKWLFEWTDPPLPDGWHSVRSGGGRGAGTWVRVR